MLNNTMKKTAQIALAMSMFCTIMAPVNVMAKEDLDNIFCDDLRDESVYDKNNFKAYKVLVKGTDGWIFRTSSDFELEFPLSPPARKQLKKMKDAFKSQGIDFIMLYPPTRGMIHADKIPAGEAERYNFTDADLSRKNYKDFISTLKKDKINIVGLPDHPTGEAFFYKRDHHWSPAGARIAAQALGSYIKDMSSYKKLKKTEYKTTSLGMNDFDGTEDKVFKKICGTVLPTENIEMFKTEPLESASAGDDLFGEVDEPEVVLVGTSNSTKIPSRANFEGFLKEALSTDILNKSISGGSIDAPIISYLNSDHYKQRKAKVVIWEVPGYYNITGWEGRVFRQVTPAVYGDCEGNAVAEAKDYKIKSGTSLLFKGLGKKKIDGDDYYLSMKFSKPVKEKFTVNFSYVNKKRTKLALRRAKRFPHDGQFFAALKDAKYGPLAKIVLDIPKKMDGLTVDARICKIP